ncbi:lipopolysaccharide/colanic/teichoic acid biosynthesis glycosyltransferase [Jejuia pallidilutea]|jgi:lipopolysaccharide/colanic/teichoic acid biosynthesis glycosyltransferase|uniref:Lipopolysaccharide/colanic/teichoic acid biosynthesis glycosyltransferase n=1 Tax=Jejuia pallidilutea TaxID=504487 RepID=A0A362X1G4_9FLAO|nr:sugar transferase [Jejuia pallidilutea]PQV50183.1 lipopolysaccharide/colanic/teichoic acid biosynthesis glycosyltransferase [Jejuia pallidilutea]
MYKFFFKSILDFLIAFVGIVILLPLFLIIFIILLFINNGKPFFFQERPGKNERIFKIMKFKTMTDKKDSNGNLLPNEDRMTTFGSFLRRTSLDEIPQLINILKGDMSLIGPRPLRVHYLPYYTKEEAVRHTVKPGVTGLAQVSGRNALSWDDKLALDIKYVHTITFLNDFKILIKTFKKVFSGNEKIELSSETLDLDELRKNS